MNICIVTLDSLRWDVARKARMNNILKYVDGACWQKCGAQGTNTLPAHVALFQGGQIPYSLDKASKYYFDWFRMFRPELNWDRNRDAVYKIPESENIVKGFESMGYTTIGIGGVHWFNTNYQTSSFWHKFYFQHFAWHKRFSENSADSFEMQIKYLRKLNLQDMDKLFLFINVATTHIPFWHGKAGWEGQKASAIHVNYRFPKLIDLVPRPCHFIVMADHGTCFEDRDGEGIKGHGFVHPSVMTVPVCDFVLD